MADYTQTREKPTDKDRLLWWGYAKHYHDDYMLIVQDQISGLEYPVFVRQFDNLMMYIARFHRVNDQWVTMIYETWGD